MDESLGVTVEGRAPALATLHVNERAARIADAMAGDADALGISVSTLAGGARLLDCGISVPGGLEAGRLLAEACMGGLGRVDVLPWEADGVRLPGVHVRTDHPAVSCLAAQYAGWAIRPEGYFAMGSGPLRAIARVEEELFAALGYGEPPDGRGVLVLETRALPDGDVAAWVAAKAGMPASALTFLAAPTASPAGGVQISARVVETALHKLLHLGFDVRRIASASGSAPLAPVAKNDLRAIGRTNDCVLYGGVVHLTVLAEDDELRELAARLPSSASPDHGAPFFDLFQRYGGDFYKVDPGLFSPAEVHLTSAASGRTFSAGGRDVGVLRRSLLS
ncbi:MAG TPA: methenyltetrahydromethanopterin cyclohydrolase [Longimicrobiales bacterium]|nr:methenyltetrahydromethanopterin cyclohydrolase [Longimicrobiales bacterium]